MKKLLLLLLVLSSLPLQAAVIGSWAQDDASGDLVDSTGNHPAGTPVGSPTFGQAGVPNGTYGSISVSGASGTAIEYGPSSADEYFVVGTDNNNPVMNLDRTAAFTVMGWINPFAPTANSTYRIISTGSAAGVDRGWGFGLRLNGLDGTGSTLRFTTYGIADNDSDPFSINFNEWIHMAATYNNGAINYFLNGVALGGSDTSLFGNESVNGRLVIGGRLGGNDVDQANGLLDGIRVYDELFSATQIQEAAALSVPEPSAFILGAVGAFCLLLWKRRLKNTSR
jgi:hypothetical protein